MTLTVRKAVRGDLPALLAIYENARRFMQTHGNPTQWPTGYPGATRLTAEIDRGVCHVVTGAGEIQAVFCLISGEDPTYRQIEDGAGRRMSPMPRSTDWHRQGGWAASGGSALTGACSRGCRCGPIPTPTTSTCSARSRQPALCAAVRSIPRTAPRVWRTTTAARTDAAHKTALHIPCRAVLLLAGHRPKTDPRPLNQLVMLST